MGGKKLLILVIIFVISSFFIFAHLFSAEADVVINEIAAYPTTTHEWVEIFNTGTSSVDILSWKFFEMVGSVSSSHVIVVPTSTTSTIINPREYAIIAQNPRQFLLDNQFFSSKIFGASWANLNEGGEEIGLINENGKEVERFIYLPAAASSLERKNPFLKDYSRLNWQVHFVSNTAGFVNSNFSTIGASTTHSTTTDIWSEIKINEIVPNPESGEEWVELFNPTTSSLSLTGGTLCDNRTPPGCIVASPTGTIPAKGWLVLPIQGNKLNNTGDSVILKNPSSTIVDQINYSGSLVPKEGQALARKSDGLDTNSDNDLAITTVLTPGAANTISSPPISNSGGGSSGSVGNYPSSSQTQTQSQLVVFATTSSKVVINELYPNPPGIDSEGEFFELKNISGETVDLDDWNIKNTSKSFALSGELGPGEIRTWFSKETNIALKNTLAEEVRLINDSGVVVGTVNYTKAPEGESYSRVINGEWKWTNLITPGDENEFSQETSIAKGTINDATSTVESGMVWKVKFPAHVENGQEVFLSAKGSVDKRGGEPLFWWRIGNEAILFGETVPYIFTSSGLYTITIVASSTAGTLENKEVTIPVGVEGVGGSNEVMISEVFSNPTENSTEEFVELYNPGIITQDIGGWKLRTKNKKIFTIPSSTYISPGVALVFYKPATNLSLANDREEVELVSSGMQVVDRIVVPNGAQGKSYSWIKDKWYWTEPAPHQILLDAPETAGGTLGLSNETKSANIIKKPIVLKNNGASVRKVSTRKVATPQNINIEKIQELSKGKAVRVQGVVTALPGIFGSQYFYIGNENGGAQIYQSKKDFPKLVLGDTVEVQGTVSETGGTKRINIKRSLDVKMLYSKNILEPQEVSVSEIDQEHAGMLVQIKGQITELKTNFMYVDDGGEEVQVYFKKGAKIDKKLFKEGEEVGVVGILVKGSGGMQLWPRSQSDIVSIEQQEKIGDQKTGVRQNQQQAENKYNNMLVGGAMLVALGLLIRGRKRFIAIFKK